MRGAILKKDDLGHLFLCFLVIGLLAVYSSCTTLRFSIHFPLKIIIVGLKHCTNFGTIQI